MPDVMNLYIYDRSFNLIALIDNYSSLIWSDRFNDCGDFELTLPYEYAKDNYLDYLKQGNYCGIDYSKRKAIIEKIEFKSEEDSAPEMIVSGRSLESILERRVIIGKVDFGNDSMEVNLQNAIKSVITDNIINPSDIKRKIPNVIFNDSTDPKITDLVFSNSYNGNDLLDIISNVCKEKHIGFRMILTDDLKMAFELYPGVDHSTEQTENDYVIFSPGYDNLKNSNFFSSLQEYRNVMIVSVAENTCVTVARYNPETEGMERREIFADKDDLKENKSTSLTSSQINAKAAQKLKNDYKIKTGIEGEIVPFVLYEYGTDYDVGDKVQLTDIYENTGIVRISEVVISFEENGFSIIPTFEEIEEE